MTRIRTYSVRFAVAIAFVMCSLLALQAATRADGSADPHRGPGTQPPIIRATPLPVPTTLMLSNGRLLPPLPRPPKGAGRVLHVRSATGATIAVTAGGGCTSNVTTLYPLGCTINWQATNLPATGQHQDWAVPANSNSPIQFSGNYGGATGPAEAATLAHYGTDILASLNTTTNQWDAIVYVTAGESTIFQTFSNALGTLPAQTFVDDGATTVYLVANGLPATDHYVVTVESTSQTGTCVFVAPPATPPAGAGQLCDPRNSSGQVAAPGGTLRVPWLPAAGLGAGTYSISIYDINAIQPDGTTGVKLAQRQVALTASAPLLTWSLTPLAGNAVLAPAPLQTPTTKFAYVSTDGLGSDTQVTATATAVPAGIAGDSFVQAVSDPNGAVVSSQTVAPSGGSIALTWPFPASASPNNYIGNTYTLSLLDATANTVLTTAAFQILGYSANVQFTTSLSNSLAFASGTVTSGVEFTNTAAATYGMLNGDSIARLQMLTPANGMTVSLSGSSSCGANCQTVTVVDSSGGSWTVTNQCLLTCPAATAQHQISLVPIGSPLAVTANITVPNVTFGDPNSSCTGAGGCTLTTTILPSNGQSWSTSALVANNTTITNGGGNTYSATGHVLLNGSTNYGVNTGIEAHGFTVRPSAGTGRVFYGNNPSFASIGQLVVGYTITNTSKAPAGKITQVQLTFPPQFAVNANTVVDPASPAWSATPCGAGAPANSFCVSNPSPGIVRGATQTVLLDIDVPIVSFSYTDVVAQVTAPSAFPVAPDANPTAFVPSSLTLDSTTMAGYSMLGGLQTVTITPSTLQSNATRPFALAFTNTTLTADPYPDYIDTVIVELPTANTLSGSASLLPAGWSLIGTNPVGGVVDYWFGLCAAQYSTANGPPNDGLPVCGTAPYATEQGALAPGATLSFNANVVTGAGTINGTVFAHGANGNAWSKGTPFAINVSAISAASGFSQIASVPYSSPMQPQVGSDAVANVGNSYVYEIQNTGSSGNITSAVITIPGLTTSGTSGTDTGGTNWTITSAPVLSGSGFSGCSVTSYTSPNAGTFANGAITIGGGSCSLTPAGVMDVTFTAQAPYLISDTFNFPTTVNGTVAAAERWFSDDSVQIVLSGSLSVSVGPFSASPAGPGGSTAVTNCPVCSFNQGTNTISFGTVTRGSSVSGLDVARVSVYTNAANPVGWKLYVSTNINPVNSSGVPTNELQTEVDAGTSSAVTGLSFDQTTFAVVPTSGNGVQLASYSSAARRLPFDLINSYQISIGPADPNATNSAIMTFTWIAN